MVIILTITFIINYVLCGDKDYDPDFNPNIYIYAEEPDRDPVEIRKWVKEQKKEKAYLKKAEKDDKDSVEAFRKILESQKSQLGKLTSLASKTTNNLNKIVGETPIRFMPWG